MDEAGRKKQGPMETREHGNRSSVAYNQQWVERLICTLSIGYDDARTIMARVYSCSGVRVCFHVWKMVKCESWALDGGLPGREALRAHSSLHAVQIHSHYVQHGLL